MEKSEGDVDLLVDRGTRGRDRGRGEEKEADGVQLRSRSSRDKGEEGRSIGLPDAAETPREDPPVPSERRPEEEEVVGNGGGRTPPPSFSSPSATVQWRSFAEEDVT